MTGIVCNFFCRPTIHIFKDESNFWKNPYFGLNMQNSAYKKPLTSEMGCFLFSLTFSLLKILWAGKKTKLPSNSKSRKRYR